MQDEVILNGLYQKRKSLEVQLEAIDNAIIGFGGKVVSRKNPSPIISVEIEPQIEEKLDVSEKTESKDGPVKKRYKSKEIQGYITMILEEMDMPATCPMIKLKLEHLGYEFDAVSVSNYLSQMARDHKIIRIERGSYAHRNYKEPQQLQKKVVTIRDVEDYIKIRKEVTRQELLGFFRDSGRLTENMIQLRVEKLIDERKVMRLERGVYKWIAA